MSKNLFYKSFFIIWCILKNKFKAITLTNICATRYSFIDKKFTKIVCQVLEIKLQYLIQPKQIQKFDNKAAKPIIHTIDFTLTINTQTESLAPLLVIKWRNYPMILDLP